MCSVRQAEIKSAHFTRRHTDFTVINVVLLAVKYTETTDNNGLMTISMRTRHHHVRLSVDRQNILQGTVTHATCCIFSTKFFSFVFKCFAVVYFSERNSASDKQAITLKRLWNLGDQGE